ncbi:MAG: vacuolar family H+-ATPase subunit H [Lachnospira sp.]|nr:vacuolar family H+-ATPase subunit H [Lachnospira sp.]
MNKIDKIISDIEAYIDSCKYQAFSNTKIIVDKEQLDDYFRELRLKTPEEVKRYQKILNTKDEIIREAKEQADTILNAAQIQTAELINEHEIMQRAYAQANELIEQATQQAQAILDNATNDANNIRLGAVEYTDDMLAKLQYIIEHSIKSNKERYTSLINDLESVLEVVNNNRNELSAVDEDDAVDVSDIMDEENDEEEDDDDFDIDIPLADQDN